jgi:hypothetical protein
MSALGYTRQSAQIITSSARHCAKRNPHEPRSQGVPTPQAYQVVRQERNTPRVERRFQGAHAVLLGDAQRLPRVNLLWVSEQQPVSLKNPRVLGGVTIVRLSDLRERVPPLDGIEVSLWRRLYYP